MQCWNKALKVVYDIDFFLTCVNLKIVPYIGRVRASIFVKIKCTYMSDQKFGDTELVVPRDLDWSGGMEVIYRLLPRGQ